MKKRIISCILTVLILASVLPANAFADSSVIHRQIHINPLYKDVVDQKQLFSTLNGAPRLYSDTQPQEAGSADEAAVILRKGMENREARIAIRCPADAITPTDGILDEIAEKAMEETGVPTQGDYIRWTYAGWSGSYSLESDDEGLHYVFVYDCKYYTTAAQEAELSEKIDSVLQSLDINDESSDYDVICAVYDYICANVSYDYDNLNDSEYLLKYTAYAAMINKTAVCQGYSALMYRMLQQKNIDCRLIPGSNHAWNIVAIDGVYYNADSTWDAGRDPKNYAYFLCGDSDFAEHTRYSEYSTEEFYRLYPMAETKYVVCPSHSYGAWVTTKAPTCTESGIETRTCAKCGVSENRAIPATGHHYDAVATAPTCTEKGYTTHTCACGDSYTDSSTDAVGHNYKAGICTICGALDPERRPASPQIMITTESGRPKISWNAVNGADKYWVYRSVDGETFDYYARTDKPSFTDGSTSIGTTYYYAVKAVAVLGGRDVSSGRSTAQSIQCRPAAPSVSIYRASGKPQLKWSAVTGAEKYWIYRSTDGVNFKYYDSTTGTSYTNCIAASGTEYYYKVKAAAVVNGKNVASDFSNTKSLFTTPAAPSVSITTSKGKPKLTWKAVKGADKYYIYRSTDGKNFKYYNETDEAGYTNYSTNIGTTYYYKVRAVKTIDGNDHKSDFSAVRSIQCRPAAVNLSISRSYGKPKLTWDAVADADKYWIYRSTDGKNFKCYDTTTKTSYINSGAAFNTIYCYKVKAVKVVNGRNVVSGSGSAKSVITALAKPSVSITTSDGKPYISWDAVDGATGYYVFRSTDGKNYSVLGYTTRTNYTNTASNAGTTYYYKVKADNSNTKTAICANSDKTAEKLVEQAKSWLGCKESDGSNEEIIDTYNGHEPVARGLKLGYKDPWCAAFVSACAIKTGMTDIIPTECGCGTMVKLFKKLGAWDENDGRIPNVGDIIFFDWDDSGYGDNDGFPGHVGIVEKVSGTKITVIDGNNKNDAVERRTVQINGRFIRGYGVPKYSGFRSGDTRSDYSNAVSVRCGLTAPTPSITTSEGKPKLTWSAVPGAAKYWVYRSTDGKSFSYLNSTVGTSYTDSGAKKNTKYYYKVKAVYSSNSDMNSALSAAVSIKATK